MKKPLFLDVTFHMLPADTLNAILRVIQCMFGCHKIFAWATPSKPRQTDPAKTTAQSAIQALQEKGIVLIFATGSETVHGTHYMLNTPHNIQLLQELEVGKMSFREFLDSMSSPPESE